MPGPDHNLPQGFPDLSLPERMDVPAVPVPAVVSSPWPTSTSSWRAGDRILAPWDPGSLFVGRIKEVRDGHALVEFEDGDAGWVLLDQIRPLKLQPRQKLLSRRGSNPAYVAAEIIEVRQDQVYVHFADDQNSQWVATALLRIPCEARGPSASPVRVASQQVFQNHLAPGDRVWAPWKSNLLYAGTVDCLQDDEAHIHFDNGNHGWVLLEQVLPLQIPVGLRVLGNWLKWGHYYTGTVSDARGDRIHINYDDGDREWTNAAALAVACEPFGPDARPTKIAFRLGPLLWKILLVLIVIVVIIAALRPWG